MFKRFNQKWHSSFCSIFILVAISTCSTFALAQDTFKLLQGLNPENFQSGDFLWAKRKGAWVPLYEREQTDLPSIEGSIYVGHVAILDIDPSGFIWVIEAKSKDGVSRKYYEDWLKLNIDKIFWHGRIVSHDQQQRSRIADEARTYVGKPYDFWNLNLENESGFYCSKLAWLAVYKSLGISLDDNLNVSRSFWFTPKKMLRLPLISLQMDSGNY